MRTRGWRLVGIGSEPYRSAALSLMRPLLRAHHPARRGDPVALQGASLNGFLQPPHRAAHAPSVRLLDATLTDVEAFEARKGIAVLADDERRVVRDPDRRRHRNREALAIDRLNRLVVRGGDRRGSAGLGAFPRPRRRHWNGASTTDDRARLVTIGRLERDERLRFDGSEAFG